MSTSLLYFKNGTMSCTVLAYYACSTEYNDNIAIIFLGGASQPFVVVRGLQVDEVNNTGDWGYAIEYDIPTLKQAQDLFKSKIS